VELTGTLAETHWESHRPAIFRAAYRILGSEAQACLSAAWQRRSRTQDLTSAKVSASAAVRSSLAVTATNPFWSSVATGSADRSRRSTRGRQIMVTAEEVQRERLLVDGDVHAVAESQPSMTAR
jgi:hypothetical protein